jgi:hypothetical protein
MRSEFVKREQRLMQEIEQLNESNKMLANKAQLMEQERVNRDSERERKNSELRSMHLELQKM